MRDLKDQLVGLDPNFSYRGLNQTRIETFSDAVFAVAFTLVVLSSAVPETFSELRKSIHDIIPSFICIVLIVVIWYQHYVVLSTIWSAKHKDCHHKHVPPIPAPDLCLSFEIFSKVSGRVIRRIDFRQV